MSVNYFYFGSIALHYSSYMAFLCLLLFLSYPDIQGRDCGTAIVPVSMNSFWRENIKRPSALASGSGKCFSFQPETGSKSINCSFLQIKEPGHEAQIRLCFLPYCHRCGGRKKNQKLGVWLNGLFTWNFSSSNKQRFKHQTPTLWNLLLLFPVFVPLLNITKEGKK